MDVQTYEAVLIKLSDIVVDFDVPVIDLIKVQTKDVYKVLVGTILSARTKDSTTAVASARLFEKAPDLHSLKSLSEKQIQSLIFPVGFYKNKARHLKKLPHVIHDQFAGRIPDDVDSLTKLPGVGRKTANLVVAVGFEKPAICVDTHVHRISNRLGFLKTSSPLQTEMQLRKNVHKEYWSLINRVLVAYGQKICTPLSPYCSQCKVAHLCEKVGVKSKR